MGRCIVGIVALTGCHQLFGLTPVEVEGDAALTARRLRSTLRIDKIAPTEVLRDFPLLVVLDDVRAARDLMLPNAADLRFFDERGTTLPHQIERVGAPNGESLIAWVRVPMLEGSLTTIGVDYGRGDPGPAAAGSVWSPSYAAVWHLGDAGVIDATGNAHNGITRGATPGAGTIGAAHTFDGATQSIEIPSSSNSFESPELTVSGWVLQRASSSLQAMLSHPIPTTSENDLYVGLSSGVPYAEVDAGTKITVQAPSAVALDTWVHLAAVASASGVRLYVDGALAASETPSGAVTRTMGAMYLGADCNMCVVPDDDFLDGRLDEVRFETTARSQAWISADVASMRDQAITYGPIDRTMAVSP